MMTTVAQGGKEREVVMIDLATLPMWLATIDGSRVAEEARPKLIRFQKECAQVLRDHFFGKPHTDPVIASLQAALQVRQAQLALEKKVEGTHRIDVEARALGQAALDVAEVAIHPAPRNADRLS
jgi:hypothetical protein